MGNSALTIPEDDELQLMRAVYTKVMYIIQGIPAKHRDGAEQPKLTRTELITFFTGEQCQFVVKALARAVRSRLQLLCQWDANLTGFPSGKPSSSEDTQQSTRWATTITSLLLSVIIPCTSYV